MLRFPFHSKVNFVHDERYGSFCILLHANIQFDLHHLLKLLPPPLASVYFWLLYLKTKTKPHAHAHLHLCLSLIPLINMPAFLPIPCCFYCYSSVVQPNIGDGDTSTILKKLFSIVLAILLFVCCVCFHVNLKIVLLRFVNNCVGILMGIALNL